MERTQFVKNFSQRLNSLLQKEGYCSTRSKAGIEITQLAKVAEVSYQMARKYALGMALPDYHVIPKIAKWLKVSPSWLLYGEENITISKHKTASLIEIESDILKYILHKCVALFPPTSEADKITNYLFDVIYDASHLQVEHRMVIKIVDMMLSSAIQFNTISHEKRA